MESPSELHAVLKKGGERARAAAGPVLKKVREAVGFSPLSQEGGGRSDGMMISEGRKNQRLSMETRIINICRRLHKKNFLAGCDGNVSARTAEGLIKITPGGLSKRSLKKEQIALMDLEGQPLKGQPSSEKFMHLAVYQEQPRAGAAVHAHPPHAVALSLARPGWRELPAALPEIIIALGKVPFVLMFSRGPGS